MCAASPSARKDERKARGCLGRSTARASLPPSLPERRGSGANVRKERIHLMVWYGRIVAAAAAAAHHWHRLRRGNGGRTN